MNTACLNVNKEKDTIEELCKKINKNARQNDLMNSIFVFSDFVFDFEWDYENKKLLVSLDTDQFDFLHPGAFHERVFRSKDLSSVMGNYERETLKRQAMKKKLENQTFSGIDMSDMLGVQSTGGHIAQALAKQKLADSRINLSAVSSAIPPEGQQGPHPSDVCIFRNGWLTFPQIENDKVPNEGGLFETMDDFLVKCNIE